MSALSGEPGGNLNRSHWSQVGCCAVFYPDTKHTQARFRPAMSGRGRGRGRRSKQANLRNRLLRFVLPSHPGRPPLCWRGHLAHNVNTYVRFCKSELFAPRAAASLASLDSALSRCHGLWDSNGALSERSESEVQDRLLMFS